MQSACIQGTFDKAITLPARDREAARRASAVARRRPLRPRSSKARGASRRPVDNSAPGPEQLQLLTRESTASEPDPSLADRHRMQTRLRRRLATLDPSRGTTCEPRLHVVVGRVLAAPDDV